MIAKFLVHLLAKGEGAKQPIFNPFSRSGPSVGSLYAETGQLIEILKQTCRLLFSLTTFTSSLVRFRLASGHLEILSVVLLLLGHAHAVPIQGRGIPSI